MLFILIKFKNHTSIKVKKYNAITLNNTYTYMFNFTTENSKFWLISNIISYYLYNFLLQFLRMSKFTGLIRLLQNTYSTFAGKCPLWTLFFLFQISRFSQPPICHIFLMIQLNFRCYDWTVCFASWSVFSWDKLT